MPHRIMCFSSLEMIKNISRFSEQKKSLQIHHRTAHEEADNIITQKAISVVRILKLGYVFLQMTQLFLLF